MATPNDRENRSPALVPNATTSDGPFYGAKTETVTIDGKTYTGVNPTTGKPPAATEIGMVSPSSGLTITGTERNMAKEREAMNLGYTKEYIASRGGINSVGYFNDTPLNRQLTAEEYKSVTKPDGSIDSIKMLAILNAKGADTPIGLGEGGGGGGTGGTGGGTSGTTGGTTGIGGATSAEMQKRQSAYDLLFEQFNQYGLGALVTPLKDLILQNVSPSEFTIRLRDSDAYKKRFAANQARIQKGLTALDEATYLDLEDKYQTVMRNYGLPSSYYARGDMGRQEGFEKLIANDVSSTELEDRILTAQNRVINAAPQIAASLRSFYPDITNGDILAYTLDPEKGLSDIKRKITAAEIGGAALMSGLATGVTRAEELAKYGVTGEAYRQAAPTIRQATERGSQLASFFGETPYTQQTAESMALNVGDAASAIERTRKLTEKERALYSGTSGIAQGALARDRAGAF